ncbi:hypothetical protein AVEN_135437-1 [Araneus ventricosus]|uniref:Uncharacterized protein n=1 Tax=Araneus ventricosus TaxID=182803 RepID=A0A4Y2BCY9_ARAVE|nr:hypothetical protein AVEN_135437-1 [Araneus ventricosus]
MAGSQSDGQKKILERNLDQSDDIKKYWWSQSWKLYFGSTLTKWALTMPIVTTISQQVEVFCGLSFTTSEHHTHAGHSRILRDNEDVQKLVGWFESHDPFPFSDFVVPVSTGILGDETINCHRAFECGNSSKSNIGEKN